MRTLPSDVDALWPKQFKEPGHLVCRCPGVITADEPHPLPRVRAWGYLACMWCVLFAALHIYWAAGGEAGSASSAGVDIATQRPLWFVLFGLWGVAVLLLAGRSSALK
jgi:hypothetical protein